MLWTLFKSIMRVCSMLGMLLCIFLFFFLMEDFGFLFSLIIFGTGFLICFGVFKLFRAKNTDRHIDDVIVDAVSNPRPKRTKHHKENEAQKWLNGYKASLDQETRMYQANQRERDRLLDEARNLDQRARYGSASERKELTRQAENLRRQAGRL